ncbi:MAG: hypothetical protein J0H52_14725, partial [Comamonadaceae bacterium]|nr:hypothetical protein [Comamonadaceae bacterium]
ALAWQGLEAIRCLVRRPMPWSARGGVEQYTRRCGGWIPLAHQGLPQRKARGGRAAWWSDFMKGVFLFL